MARFLLATVPLTGHVTPGLPIARELIKRGHEVHWYTGRKFQARIEATGVVYEPMHVARDVDDIDIEAAFPERRTYTGIAKMKYDLKHVFTDSAVGQIGDLKRILVGYPADVILSDTLFIGATFLPELGGPLWAGFGVTILGLNSRDTAPIGLALPPNRSPLGRLRNHTLNFLLNKIMFRDVARNLDDVREKLGLPRRGVALFDTLLSPNLFVQGTIPQFEYPRSDLEPQVHFVGPILPTAPAGFRLPAWWSDLHGNRPVVLVTQGTLATNAEELLVPTIKALAHEDVLVIATTGGKPVESFPLNPLPNNVRLEPFIPFSTVMPHVSVLVTNGGYGSTHFALSHGIPIVAAGQTEDKAEIGMRVQWADVGINLRTQPPTPEQVRQAVKTILTDPHYRRNVRLMQEAMAQHNAAAEAADLLEELAATRKPVFDSPRKRAIAPSMK